MQHVHHSTRVNTKSWDRAQNNRKQKAPEVMIENQTKSSMKEIPLRIRHQPMSQLLPQEASIEHYVPPSRVPLIEWDPWIVIPTRIQDTLNQGLKDMLHPKGSKFDSTPKFAYIRYTNKHSTHTSNLAQTRKIWCGDPNPYHTPGIERVFMWPNPQTWKYLKPNLTNQNLALKTAFHLKTLRLSILD